MGYVRNLPSKDGEHNAWPPACYFPSQAGKKVDMLKHVDNTFCVAGRVYKLVNKNSKDFVLGYANIRGKARQRRITDEEERASTGMFV